ncbi:hypothetical protein CDL15_Pgr000078 [Punica granatum]|uniref:Aminotransferase-like plant mobile domain-containing protein n=1 Tax=Punica granatum TaxID=22663 RepID=A0A218VR29_PUNGR|nr:hypothetical protein CDL15_Pgr000078 [Punica granatum]PKI67682.1 hypothetical protein CRG98_011895 [Punica granatum]
MEEDECIVEERKALIVPPTGRDTKPVFRTAHFLKPTYNGGKPPPLSPSSFYLLREFDLSRWPLKVNFLSWKNPSSEWERWAAQMELKHGATWKKAGILEAIRASRQKTLVKDLDLLLTLAQRWSPETNTFIFPWGEATVTLEDVMVIGAYSVLGSSVLTPLVTGEMKEAERELKRAKFELSKVNHYRVRGGPWVKRFMGSGSEVEHEAFLALWLSQFVLPQSVTVIESTFPTAIHLARGTRIALAPAVLAAIYRDLSLLKKGIDRSAHCSGNYETDDENGALKLYLWAQFQLVQAWVWERFPTVRLNPNVFRDGEPRITRWITRKLLKLPDLGKLLGSATEVFRWRPYARLSENPKLHKFYPENERWVLVGSDSDDELLSFARFLMPCELLGLDGCVVQYLPHRVAMQFGMDQDLPCYITQSHLDSKIAWTTFDRPITNIKVYIPSRVSEAGLTTRYLEWWEESKTSSKAPVEFKDVELFKNTPEGSKVPMNNNVEKEVKWSNLSVPPGFEQKWSEVEVLDLNNSSNPEGSKVLTTDVQMKMKGLNFSVPPGFEPKQCGNFPPGFELKRNEFNMLDSGNFSEPKSPEVLMSSVQNKMKEIDLTVQPGLERNGNKVEILDSDDSSDDDHTITEQFLKRQKRYSIGNSAVRESNGSLIHHVLSSTLDNSSLRRGKLPLKNVQSIVEDEAIRTEDNAGNLNKSGDSTAEYPGRNRAETTIKSLKDRLSKAEEFIKKHYASKRAMRG